MCYNLLSSQMWVIILMTSIFFFLMFKNRAKSVPRRRLPPGPTPLPFIGNLLKLASNKPHKALAELARTYGPIMTLKFGSLTTIIISSPALAKEVYLKHDISLSTPFIPSAVRAYEHDQYSIAWLPTSSTKWRILRKIFKAQLLSNQRLDTTMQRVRRKEVDKLMDYIHKSAKFGGAIDITQALLTTTFSFMLGCIFSMDSSHSSSREIMELLSSMKKEIGTPNLCDYFPLLEKMDPQGIRYRLTIICGKLFKVFDEIIDARLEAKKDKKIIKSPNDMLDTLLDIMEAEDKNDQISRRDILHTILDLFGAGIDTTSVTLEWAMTELIHNAPVMKKAQKEIDMNIGKIKEKIEESDIAKLPYLQAIVKETFRLHPAAPLLLPHKAQDDIEIFGFTVPKGSQLLVNVWAIGRHPGAWPDQDSFVPERFLGSEVELKGQHFGLIPFGAGRRICPGLPLACRTIHLVLGSMISSFNWVLEGSSEFGKGVDMDMEMDDEFRVILKKVCMSYLFVVYDNMVRIIITCVLKL